MKSASRHFRRVVFLVLAAVATSACGSDSDEPGSKGGASTTRPAGDTPKLQLVEVGRFEAPVHVLPVPGTDLMAVVEKGGRVRVAAGMQCVDVGRCPKSPIKTGDVVVDLSDEVSDGSEQGLLGMVFHPNWPDDPRIFLDYTDTAGDTHVEAWELSSPTARATRSKELLQIQQPYENHNGGHLAFGPDGLLYVGMGDGGSGGDPEDRAQKADELLGKLLRLDVDGGGERGFAIPEGNVRDGAPEAWAIGLRNPWRFSFDSKTGDLWIGDVGQDSFEEIDALTRAQLDGGTTPNFGWRRREGYASFDDSGTAGPGDRIDPVLAYGRTEGCSVTGGIVYRGSLVPRLRGWYVFTDFCADDLRLVDAAGVPGSQPRRGVVTWVSAPGAAQVASIAAGHGGELFVVSLDGAIRQVLPA
ncbi:MAG: glucose/sorbosone dehydrogenase-like protein [Thermoleophilia bacterium]|nr:glucose/sorbosone dehydrogenase-like protein [Thermoleophilia bacterium]